MISQCASTKPVPSPIQTLQVYRREFYVILYSLLGPKDIVVFARTQCTIYKMIEDQHLILRICLANIISLHELTT